LYGLIMQVVYLLGILFGVTTAIIELKKREQREGSQLIVSICILIGSLAAFLRITFFGLDRRLVNGQRY